jgi:hypothetical protein
MALIGGNTKTKLGERLARLDVNCAASFVGALPETILSSPSCSAPAGRGRDA